MMSLTNEIIENKILVNEINKKQCVFMDRNFGVMLYKIDCIKFMDELINVYP